MLAREIMRGRFCHSLVGTSHMASRHPARGFPTTERMKSSSGGRRYSAKAQALSLDILGANANANANHFPLGDFICKRNRRVGRACGRQSRHRDASKCVRQVWNHMPNENALRLGAVEIDRADL